MHGYPDHTIDFSATEKGNSCFRENMLTLKMENIIKIGGNYETDAFI